MASSGKGKGKGVNRRQFVGNLLRTACGVGLMGMGLGMYSRQASPLPAMAIRPPGALPEEEFLGACIRCGLCWLFCPDAAIERTEDGHFQTDVEYCKGCGICARECPVGCISMVTEEY